MDLEIIKEKRLKGKKVQYYTVETKSGFGVYIDEVDDKGNSIDSEYVTNLSNKRHDMKKLAKELYNKDVRAVSLISALIDMKYLNRV